MKTLDLVFFDAGGGHRSAANALCEVVTEQSRPWQMRTMNLQELLDELDVFRKITRVRAQDIYNLMLRRGWTLGSPQMMKLMHWVIRMYHPSQVKLLQGYWRAHPTDLVVSLIPNFNRALHESLRGVWPKTPLVTIMTDLADFPPHFWIERDQEQYFICGSDRAYRQAVELGHSTDRIFRTSGMILSPKFYRVPTLDKRKQRELLGLKPDLPTVMLMFGGEGSERMLEIARALNASNMEVQILAMAGKNKGLEAKLKQMSSRVPMHVEGFTRDIPHFMQLADIFIGKPGPGSISEAMMMGLPVIIENNVWTLPQERYNAEWVEEAGVGVSLKKFETGVVEAVRQLLNPERREKIMERIRAQNNRAVYEIPEILNSILEKA